MKQLSWIPLILLLAQMFQTETANAADICLRVSDIKSATSPDGKTLIFRMQNGDVWANKLHGPCPDLKFNGFVWVVRGTEIACENQQSLRVLQSGEICTLGKFTKLPSQSTHSP